MEYAPFQKIARLTRECTITEKIDGTNGCIYIGEAGEFLVGSRTRWITPDEDNYGFARWAHDNKQELMRLGVGHHFGEWWGAGIQRRYDQAIKRFSLFNTSIWSDDAIRPACCDVVPVLYSGMFCDEAVKDALNDLGLKGSRAALGFMNAEGIIIYHHAARIYFKKTLHKDEEYKGKK
jgi:hypothetical protein